MVTEAPFDVRVFQGSAVSAPRHPLGYPAGERHDLIVFVRHEAGSDDDMMAVESLMRKAGWKRAILSQPMVLSHVPPPISGDDTLRNSYHDAMAHGGAVLICREASV